MTVDASITTFPVSNETLLRAVFGLRWGEALVASFTGDPRKGANYTCRPARVALPDLVAGANNYYDVALPRPGGTSHKIADFGELCAVVLDDVGVKVDLARAEQILGPPSYLIETSPGSCHAGWIVEPLSDREWVAGMLRTLRAALGGDNLQKVSTLVRLPVGTNGKNGFSTRLTRWMPNYRILHTDWIEIEKKIGRVTPFATRVSVDSTMPDPAEIEADPVLQVLRSRGMVLGSRGRGMTFGWGYDIECPWAGDHSDPRRDAGYVPVAQKFKCHHGHCQDKNYGDLKAWADAAMREDSGGLETLARQDFDDIEPDPKSAGVDWKSRWQYGKNGAPASNVYNVLTALEGANEFAGAFGLNGFTMRQMLHRELPGTATGTTRTIPREWRDQDTILLQKWLQGQGLRTVTSYTVDSAVSTVMHEKSYHPVRDWLAGLTWDRVPRLDSWISRYLGTPYDPYHAGVGRWWLMTMCRRVFEPGCRADYMVVLEGPQGLEKSSALCAIAGGPEWFSDGLPDISNKDASDHLNGRWLIEIAEMDRFDRAESAAMKAFVSRTTERYRKAFGRRTGTEPRQCMFAGTVNHRSYLKDETGNRRYWPISVGQIDLKGLALVRDQLFAEAWTRAVTQNEQYWPDPLFEDLFISPEQDARMEADLWEPLVVDFLRDKTRALVRDVTIACTGGGAVMLSTTNRNRVTRIMETLRWRRGKKGPNNERFWYPH